MLNTVLFKDSYASMVQIADYIPWYRQEGWTSSVFPFILLELITSFVL